MSTGYSYSDFFDSLDVPSNRRLLSDAEIKSAVKRKLRSSHPDHHGNREEVQIQNG